MYCGSAKWEMSPTITNNYGIAFCNCDYTAHRAVRGEKDEGRTRPCTL